MSDSSTELEWYLARDGKRHGPITNEELKRLVQGGHIKPSDQLWRQGFQDWMPALEVRELQPNMVPVESNTPRRRTERRIRPTPDLHVEPVIERSEIKTTHPIKDHGHYDERKEPIFMEDQPGIDDAYDRPRFMNREAPNKGSGSLRKIAFSGLAVVLVIITCIVVLPFILPSDFIRDQITSLVKTQTGRDLIVRGKTSLSAFPSLGLELHDVTLSNPPGLAGEPLLRTAVLDIKLKLLPLLQSNVEVDQFILRKPSITLRVDRQGRKNWVFKPEKNSGSAKNAQNSKQSLVKAGFPFDELSLGAVGIVDGTVTYIDEKAGSEHNVKALNVSLHLPRLSEPMEAEGDFLWRAEKFDFKTALQSPEALINSKPSDIDIALTSKHIKSTFEGKISSDPAFKLSGKTKTGIPSLRALAAWAGSPVEKGEGLGQLSFSSDLHAQKEVLTFTKAKMSLDKMNAEGDAKITLNGKRPHIKARLVADQLDLNTYLSSVRSKTGTKQNAASKSTQQGPDAGARDSLTQLIKKINAPQNDNAIEVKQPNLKIAQGEGSALSKDPRPGQGNILNQFNADVQLKVQRIVYQALKIGNSKLAATLDDGLLKANLTDLQLYDGRGTGQLVFDNRKQKPGLSTVLRLDNVSALPLLKDALNFDWVSGKAKIVFDLVGSGTSKKELLSSLQGKGNINFEDGAIEGVNIPKAIRAFQKGKLNDWAREETAKTDFSELSGTFNVQNGVATNKDLKLVGPLLRATGDGKVNLVKETLDYNVKPKLVASLEGQGSAQELEGFTVPVRIYGPWKKPRVSADLAALAKDPDAIAKGVEQAKKALKSLEGKKVNTKEFENLIKGFLGEKK